MAQENDVRPVTKSRTIARAGGCLGAIVFLGLILFQTCLGPDSPRNRKAVSKELAEAVDRVLQGKDVESGLSRIREGAKSRDSFERSSAVGAIGYLGSKAASLMPDLRDALHAKDPLVLREAACCGEDGRNG